MSDSYVSLAHMLKVAGYTDWRERDDLLARFGWKTIEVSGSANARGKFVSFDTALGICAAFPALRGLKNVLQSIPTRYDTERKSDQGY